MVQYKYNSAGISAQEIGSLGPIRKEPAGRSACVIGTSELGPAFVPLTLGSIEDFETRYGTLDGTRFGPLAVAEWLRNATSIAYIRALGVGDGKRRDDYGDVFRAGFTVGEEQPFVSSSGLISSNSFANPGGPLGRTYFLGCFMSESAGSTYFSSAGLQGTGSQNGISAAAIPIIRGVLMAPSGVILRLSSSGGGFNSDAPANNLIAKEDTAHGTTLGTVSLNDNTSSEQQFVLLLNGYNSGSASTIITASFDLQSPNYFANIFNTTASYIQERGHYLYAHWDIHPAVAVLTGTNVVAAGADVPDDSNRKFGTERSAFLITSSLSRDVGSTTVPNYEAFRERFTHAKTPWFISQKFHNDYINLFRFHALSDGSGVANKYKITIKNIIPQPEDAISKYGSFDVLIRNIDDPDTESSIPLESHIGLNLDPSSDKYISKVIGDLNVYYDFDRPDNEQKIVVEGNYALNSRFIRVEVSNDVHEKSCPEEALPLGFRGISHLITSGSAPLAPLNVADSVALTNADYLRNTVQPPLPMRLNSKTSSEFVAPSTNKSWGVIFNHALSDVDERSNKNFSIASYTTYFPNNSTTNINFSVGDNNGTIDTSTNGILDADRFCYNLFTLENIKIVTGSNGTVDPSYKWNLAEYVRNGEIQTDDDSKTRRINIGDFRSGSNTGFLSYNVIMQGGFDGVNIFDFDEANLTNAAASADMLDFNRGRLSAPTISSYLKALNIAGNTVNVDFSLLAIPGIREPVITNEAIDIAEQRYDALFLMDLEEADTIQDVIDASKNRAINSSFVAAYYPDAIIKPFPLEATEIIVPPSVVALGAMALNDSIGYPWFAPAGVTRGILATTINPTINFSESELNKLYNNNINPLYSTTNIKGIQNFGNISGVVLWGQKTMQRSASAFERINVRRLLLEIRRIIKDVAIRLLFEPNRNEIVSRFNAAAVERLNTIKTLGGMDDYKVIIDSSTDVENNTLRGKIYIKPKKYEEFASLDFLVSNTES